MILIIDFFFYGRKVKGKAYPLVMVNGRGKFKIHCIKGMKLIFEYIDVTVTMLIYDIGADNVYYDNSLFVCLFVFV